MIDESRKDKRELPVLAIDCETGENERLMRKDNDEHMADYAVSELERGNLG